MLKIPLSGGPHSGKTTTIEALKLTYPDACFVEEAAEKVIRRELKKQGAYEEVGLVYEAALPVENYPRFQPLVLKEAIELESEIPEGAELVFLDRSLIDHVGYCHLNALEERAPEIEGHIAKANYAFSLFCEPIDGYQQTAIRRESPEQAEATHTQISLAYDRSDIDVVHLPAVSVEERLCIIADALKDYTS